MIVILVFLHTQEAADQQARDQAGGQRGGTLTRDRHCPHRRRRFPCIVPDTTGHRRILRPTHRSQEFTNASQQRLKTEIQAFNS